MQVFKWGDCLAIRLPGELVDVFDLREGDDFEVVVCNDGVFLVLNKPGRASHLAKLRQFRGRLPPDFRFDRDDANTRASGTHAERHHAGRRDRHRHAPVSMTPGDMIEMDIGGIGALSNPVVDERLRRALPQRHPANSAAASSSVRSKRSGVTEIAPRPTTTASLSSASGRGPRENCSQ